MKRLSTLLAVLLFLASGCGQSGPLYLPDNPSKIERLPPKPRDGEEEKEKDSDTSS